MPVTLSEDQWAKIKADVLSKNAIIFLGPSATVNFGDPRRQHDAFAKLAADHKDVIAGYHEADGFLIFSRNGNGRNELGGEISQFYQQIGPNDLLKVLAEIPVSLYVSITPDDSMQQTFRALGFPFETAYLSREPLEDQFAPTVVNPFIYNLMGYAYDENSLVLSHRALFEVVSFLQKKDSLPQAILDAFSPGIGGGKKSMIFLGFEFDKWYYHFLMYLLRFSDGVSHFAATDHSPEAADVALYSAHFDATFIDDDLLSFAQALRDRIPAEKRRSAQVKQRQLYSDFLLDGLSETEFTTLCSNYFPKAKREFGTGQTMSQRVEILLEEVQKTNNWTLLGAKLKEANPKRYGETFSANGN